MSGFDHQRIFTSVPISTTEKELIVNEDGEVEYENFSAEMESFRDTFKNFLRTFQLNRTFIYREALKNNYNMGRYWLEVNWNHLLNFAGNFAQKLKDHPTDYLPVFEEAAREVADEVTRPRCDEDKEMHDIQVMLSSSANILKFRDLESRSVSKLIKISGIVLTASAVRSKATKISLMCRSCRSVLPNIGVKPGLEGYALPRKCLANQGVQAGDMKCPLDPYFIMPDKVNCVDFQILKLQETPECVPPGEMPRHMTLYCERFLCEKAVPGNRITVLGIYCIKKTSSNTAKSSQNQVTVGVRIPYIRVIGLELDKECSGRSSALSFSAKEEEEFKKLAASSDAYERIAKSIAPSIYGAADIKKAIACLLFGGSRKQLPDGLARRGDINVLLLGDPGTAKSQLLKFVEKVSPIAVYTSGKGSSAAGLTASVNRDPTTRNFVMEGGAMVLADGGVVCIDEFDKMREDDRVAIHEAMEQQTISIAKAGITTTLNSRCAVFAAANSIFGRWDDLRGDENIDFMPTILSRFDMIFIVKDEHNAARDSNMARHVVKVHTDAQRNEGFTTVEDKTKDDELSLLFLKKYIAYCRSHCGPRLSAEAGKYLQNRYVTMRSENREREIATDKHNVIPITVRQLEAIIRIAESLAKMKLKPFASEQDVIEALRLFKVSTLAAAQTGNLDGVDEFTTKENQETINRIEDQFKRRFPVGTQVSELTIIQDFVSQKYPESAVQKVIRAMLYRGDIQYRHQRKALFRIK